MHKLRVSRTPLIAVLGFLAFLAVPAAAQAHHIEATASCKLVGDQAVATLKVNFVGFTTQSQPTVRGKVWLDGVAGSERSWTNAAPPLSWNNTTGNATLTQTWNVDGGKSYLGKAQFSWIEPSGNKVTGNAQASTGTCPKPPTKTPGIKVVKSGPDSAYVGDQVTFTFKVTNTGDTVLTNPVVTDDKCAPVTKVPDGQNQFDPGDTWTYTCTTTITDAMGDELVNTVEACGKYGNTDVCDTDDHKTRIPKPAIELDKTGATTANAGDTFTYSFKATNIGNVTLTNVVLTDNKCQSTLTRVEPNLADATFDKGDSWYYQCTVIAPAGPAQVDNVAKVCGDFDDNGKLPKKTVCDEDTHTFTVPPPGNPPENPPSNPPADNPPGSTPDSGGGVLPEEIVSGRAALRGPSGCVKQAFSARVRGRSIASVTFFVDGRQVKKSKTSFKLKVNPKRYGLGRHKIVALVRFDAASQTKARRLPLTFRRCAQGAVAPRFTG
jgi:hypothetical protein